MKWLLAVCLVGVVGLTGCTGIVCACLEPTSAVIAGRVLAADGNPLEGASVRGLTSAATPTCSVGNVAGSDSTDEFGRYRTRLVAFRDVTRCVFVEVQPPPGSALRDTIVGPFRLTLRGDTPLDVLVLDVRLAP